MWVGVKACTATALERMGRSVVVVGAVVVVVVVGVVCAI